MSPTRLRCESLEPRHLLATICSVDDGVLSVTADDEPNEIVALRDGDLLVVHVDGDSCIANSADILHLAIDARGGDDRIGVQDGVEQTTTLDGGWRWTVAGEMM